MWAVDARRIQRYQDKLAHAAQRLDWFEAWHPDGAKDPRSRLAAYKAMQEAVEAFSDVASMVTVDLSRGVKDDATNFALLGEQRVVAESLVPLLIEANGLRNALVHEYEGIDDGRVRAAAARLVPALRRAIEEVRAWLARST